MGISFDFLLHVGLQVLLVLDLMLLCIISSVYQFAFCATWLDDLHPGFQIREILLERATHEPRTNQCCRRRWPGRGRAYSCSLTTCSKYKRRKEGACKNGEATAQDEKEASEETTDKRVEQSMQRGEQIGSDSGRFP